MKTQPPHAALDTLLCEPHAQALNAGAGVQGTLADEEIYVHLAALFAAIADPTRARIVHMLSTQELCTCEIAAIVGVSDSAVSQHLRILRSLRLVRSRRAGKFVYYALDDAHVSTLIQIGLTHQGHAVDAGAAVAGGVSS